MGSLKAILRRYVDDYSLNMEPDFQIGNVATLKTRSKVLQWYIDFNAGGTSHSDLEISSDLLNKEVKF